MMFYSPELLLLSDDNLAIILAVITALIGVYFLSAAVQGWFFRKRTTWYTRVLLLAIAVLLMLSGLTTDAIALGLIVVAFMIQKFVNKRDRKSTRLNSSHDSISYAVFC